MGGVSAEVVEKQLLGQMLEAVRVTPSLHEDLQVEVMKVRADHGAHAPLPKKHFQLPTQSCRGVSPCLLTDWNRLISQSCYTCYTAVPESATGWKCEVVHPACSDLSVSCVQVLLCITYSPNFIINGDSILRIAEVRRASRRAHSCRRIIRSAATKPN